MWPNASSAPAQFHSRQAKVIIGLSDSNNKPTGAAKAQAHANPLPVAWEKQNDNAGDTCTDGCDSSSARPEGRDHSPSPHAAGGHL